MNILWVKDNKQGHLKQVKALLEEIKKLININISELDIDNKLFKKRISPSLIESKNLVIGAGHTVYPYLLKSKKINPDIKSIAILSPTYFKKKFDLICAPFHDMHKLNKLNNVLYFDGSLATRSDKNFDNEIAMMAIGGKNKYFEFDKTNLINQIQYIITLYPNKNWYIFNSRRTPKHFLSEISDHMEFMNKNITLIDHVDNKYNFDEFIQKSSIKVITPDSMSMIYESLSSKGETILFSLFPKKDHKFLPIINNLKEMNSIGYIDQSYLTDINIYKTNLVKQKNFNTKNQTEDLAKKNNKSYSMKDANFLSIGKLEKNENFEELINSWTKFNENLVICGNGSLKKKLQELISNTNQSNKIHIINPKSFTLEELFSKSKCLLLISNTYDTSIIAINALKNNVPVLATENKNISFLLPQELIHHNNQALSFTQFLENYVPSINQYKFDAIFSYIQNKYKDNYLNKNNDFYDLVFNKDK